MSLLASQKRRVVQPKLPLTRSLILSSRESYNATSLGYEVDITAEPLSKYRQGGYHPVHLGAQFKYGRYRVTHKLGWGGEATVWLARDLRASKLVALKVLIADESGRNDESIILRRLFSGAGIAHHPGADHLTQLLDSFWHTGPNGTHECLVLTVAGTNAQDQAQKYADGRLPAEAAYSIAKQLVLAVDRLHTMDIAHADIHTRNIMLSPIVRHYSNIELLQNLPKPYIADVSALPPYELNQHMPKYLVEATALPFTSSGPNFWQAQLVDLGQSFDVRSAPKTSRTPLVLRAPEMVLSKTWDQRIDIWSLACTIFELVTGQPPFDTVSPSQNRLVQEWEDLFGELPEGWRSPWRYRSHWVNDEETGIVEWLKEIYFRTGDRNETLIGDQGYKFDEENLDCLGDLLQQMFRYKPEERLQTGDILQHKWFTRSPFMKSNTV